MGRGEGKGRGRTSSFALGRKIKLGAYVKEDGCIDEQDPPALITEM